MDMNSWVVLGCMIFGSALIASVAGWELGVAAGLFSYVVMPNHTGG